MPHLKPLLACVGLLGTLAACEMLGPPSELPTNAQLMLAPADYRAWWDATEACSGRSGDFDSIEWYVVPGVASFETPEGPKVGLWSHSSAGMRVVIADSYAENELVVRHEMLHALLDRGGHPDEYFTTRCHLTWDAWSQTQLAGLLDHHD